MQILRMPAVKDKAGHRSDASVYNAIRDGLWTAGVAIGQRAKGWPDYEVDAIISARIAGKSDEQIRELVKVLHANRAELARCEWVPAMNRTNRSQYAANAIHGDAHGL